MSDTRWSLTYVMSSLMHGSMLLQLLFVRIPPPSWEQVLHEQHSMFLDAVGIPPASCSPKHPPTSRHGRKHWPNNDISLRWNCAQEISKLLWWITQLTAVWMKFRNSTNMSNPPLPWQQLHSPPIYLFGRIFHHTGTRPAYNSNSISVSNSIIWVDECIY